LPSLKLAQAEIGWLPSQAIAEVADLVGVSHASANELATFYSMLFTRPPGQKRIEVCVSLPCALAGGDRLLKDLSEGLGVKPGYKSADGSIELIRTVECFGACHRAPMCRVGLEYREHLNPEATQRLIAELKAETQGTNGTGVTE
jgi:NADH-quinone oxidoreductase subunit E